MSALKSLSQPVDQWQTLLIHMAKKKLDYVEQRDWQNTINERTPNNMPTMEEFLKFLTDRCNTLRVLDQGKMKPPASKPAIQRKPDKRVSLTVTTWECHFCKGNHSIYRCDDFKKLTPDQRKREIVSKQLCLNCLGPGHMVRQCRASSCKRCSGRHNTMLHKETEPQSKETEHQSSETNLDASEVAMIACHGQRTVSTVLLSTARVNAYDVDGNSHPCRVLLDPGSQSNVITESLVERLRLPKTSEMRAISGINQSRNHTANTTEVRITSQQEVYETILACLILPSITEKLPQVKIDVTKLFIPRDGRMADPTFWEPGNIDILIGAGLYWRILMGSPRNRIDGQPSLQNTRLGWIIGGEVPVKPPELSLSYLGVTNDTLNRQVERFWKQEELLEPPQYSEEEKECEQQFVKTSKREPDGRFIVQLPKRAHIVLGDSREQATRRLFALERRFRRNPQLKDEYVKFMNDYLEQGHMSIVQDENQEGEIYFLPHQAVLRSQSVTTKLRVVFDASAKTTTGTSLNDKLIPGPNLQKDLFDIILRFRTYEYVMTADVAMMYRQIKVDAKYRPLQRILWRKSQDEPVQVLELNTLTYGTSCAPYLAIRCLRKLADEEADLVQASRAVKKDCYMDDVLTGARTIDDASSLQQQLSELLIRGQFYLRKWRANDPRVLQHLKDRCETDSLLNLDKDTAHKTLGLLWNSVEDRLQYQIEDSQSDTTTKREVLSKIAQVFDPLGLIAPLLINGKIIMQQLWLLDIDWDQRLPTEVVEAWNRYYTSLARLNELKVPRNVVPQNESEQFLIFGFGDASEKAYGACLYTVSVNQKGDTHSNLLCARSKVAPVKTISIPRLELEAALLLAMLYNTAQNALGSRIREARLWSDSTIVLGWVKTQPRLLKTFVANRVSKIQTLTSTAAWYHVPTEDNPADLLSRGITIERLIEEPLWWNGPQWLTSGNPWPTNMEQPESVLPEMKTAVVVLSITTESSILDRFSDYKKLVRVIAYCLRWKRKLRVTKVALSVEELEYAEKTIARMVQKESFSQELKELRQDNAVSRKSKLRPLDPYLDNEGLIRVGGRLRNADIANNRKHPIVLPPKHIITRLIMTSEHVRLRHCLPEQLLSIVRGQFWPISGRREAHRVVKSCVTCFRTQPSFYNVKMGDLPKQRINEAIRPFVTTGVDYAGPLQIRESRRRGRIHISKGYMAIFTCFRTKAVHLEMVTELTTEAFLAALRRFTARRGICSEIFSDNATNFAGAARDLQEVYEFLKKENSEIATNLANQRIQWTFIPPRAPNFGGLWEAAVKVVKRHLHTVTRGLTLTFEEYYTLLTEIEAIMNSRPLTALSTDPNDLSVLTPSHFLIGDSLLQPAQRCYLEVPDNRLSRWQHLQKVRQTFWRRWHAEYLQELQTRTKWSTHGKDITLDTLVMLKKDHRPPLQWAIGRVVELHPGPDGITRVVSVRTKGGIFKRAVRNLCPIPTSVSDDE